MRIEYSDFRPPAAALAGATVILIGTVVYSYELALISVPTPESVAYLTIIADVYLLATLGGIALAAFGLRKSVRDKVTAIGQRGLVPLSPRWIIPYVLTLRRYRRVFLASTILYGIFYAIITSMLVYQPTVDFATAYGAAIPSILVTPVTGAPFFTPVLTVYLTNHFGMLLVPLTILLLTIVAVLVGVNSALVVFAFDSRARGSSRNWLGGLGALVGLFTGCPTCAGLFFANSLGGTGAVAFATLLGYYQPAFILFSLPALAVVPYLTSRSLSKVYEDGCVTLR